MSLDSPFIALVQLILGSKAFESGFVLEDTTGIVFQRTTVTVVLAQGTESLSVSPAQSPLPGYKVDIQLGLTEIVSLVVYLPILSHRVGQDRV